jgi:rRNA-processing protein FCF1
MRLFVDTNAWLRCAALRIDVWEEAKRVIPGRAEVCTLDRVLDELVGLKSAGGTLAREAALALSMIKAKKVTTIPAQSAPTVDDAIVLAASEPDFVLTQDKELKRKLKAKHVGVVCIRAESHLELENKS